MSHTIPRIAYKASAIAFSRNYFARFVVFCTLRGLIAGVDGGTVSMEVTNSRHFGKKRTGVARVNHSGLRLQTNGSIGVSLAIVVLLHHIEESLTPTIQRTS